MSNIYDYLDERFNGIVAVFQDFTDLIKFSNVVMPVETLQKRKNM